MGSVQKKGSILDVLFSDTTTALKLIMAPAPAVPFVWETVATTTMQGIWFYLCTNLTGAHGAFHVLARGTACVC